MQTYLVTGGAGFIGSNIVRALLEQGKHVRVLDNFSTGKRENLSAIHSEIELIEGDIRDLDCVRKAANGVDVVLHQAALPSVPRSIEDPLTTNEVNVTGTLNVLLAARDAGARRVVAASSSSVYGNSPTLPKSEDMPVEPLSPYAVSKLAAERYCQSFSQVYGLPTIALRYFNVFGPYQDPTSFYSAVIPKFITMMLRGERPTINGDGCQTRDFTYIDNVVAANLLAAEADPSIFGYFNAACEDRISLLALVDGINTLLATELQPVHGPSQPGDVKDSQASIAKIKSALGFAPEMSFQEGLARTVLFLRAQMSSALLAI
ncbi:MAG: SDR family oxidoreductase [Herpetosiphonaceae bacterium]|nr:SDR family oxidoreductase [Herpetosiphonaceae bacterium]